MKVVSEDYNETEKFLSPSDTVAIIMSGVNKHTVLLVI